jgi:hypothetical protein
MYSQHPQILTTVFFLLLSFVCLSRKQNSPVDVLIVYALCLDLKNPVSTGQLQKKTVHSDSVAMIELLHLLHDGDVLFVSAISTYLPHHI